MDILTKTLLSFKVDVLWRIGLQGMVREQILRKFIGFRTFPKEFSSKYFKNTGLCGHANLGSDTSHVCLGIHYIA